MPTDPIDPTTTLDSLDLPTRLVSALNGYGTSKRATVADLVASFSGNRIPRNVGVKTLREASALLLRCGIDVDEILGATREAAPRVLVSVAGREWTVTEVDATSGNLTLTAADVAALGRWMIAARELTKP